MTARVVVSLMSVAALVVTGMSWWTVRGVVSGFTISQALGFDFPRSKPGSTNILLIGLDSRRDQDGNELPQDLLDELHAGDSDSGGYNTNTLILAHINPDNHVTAFSIPRDDYVSVSGIPGYSHIKIKEAYGLKKAAAAQKLHDEGTTDQKELERQGREAGRAATISAVRGLTGAAIDYFAEISLAGFYDLTSTLGGVDVCLNQAVEDEYSGADFPAGRQTLNASQALAFVRQRHGLDNGDLDRTHRQQAFLVSVMHKLQDSGTFTDLDKMRGLLSVARKDIVLSRGWNDELFQRVGAINGTDVEYKTLPVLRYDNVDGQDVNIIDPDAIKTEVAAAFSDDSSQKSKAKPISTVDVINAGSTTGLAAAVASALTPRGFTQGDVRNSLSWEPKETGIDYGAGAAGDAQNLAGILGITASPHPSNAEKPGHIRVVLGAEYDMPAGFSELGAKPTTAQSTSTDSEVVGPDSGKPVDGGGVPCVD
jgi:LCP family protein required for cell wall assembly